MPKAHAVPAYQAMLGAYHEAFAVELRRMVADLPLRPGDRALDVACGDGSYSRWLAERVGPSGQVAALDVSPAYLDLARRNRSGYEPIAFVLGSIEAAPFAEGAFDLAWCAQSFRDLPDPVDALRRMARAVRPGGTVAVLEDDQLHQVLLPWPVGLELAVRRAELRELDDAVDDPGKHYIGRRLSQLFRAAGLADCTVRTYATNRQAPLAPAERTFLEEYLSGLRRRVADRLDPAALARFDLYADPGSDRYLLDQPDFALTLIDHVVTAIRPAT